MSDLIKDLGHIPEEPKTTKEELQQEDKDLSDRIHHLREMEVEAKQTLREALDNLNGIQKNIEIAWDKLEINNLKLQTKDY